MSGYKRRPDATPASFLRSINQDSGGLLVPTIKLVKSWNYLQPTTAQLKSFAIETIVTRMFRVRSADDLGEALRNVFDFVVYCGPIGGPSSLLNWKDDCGISLGRFQVCVSDVTELRGNVLAGVDPELCIKFVDKARINRDRIQDALNRPTSTNVRRPLEKIFKCRFR